MVINVNDANKNKREPFEFVIRSGDKFTLKHFDDVPKTVWIDTEDNHDFLYNLLSHAMSEEEYYKFDEADVTIGELNYIMDEWMKHSGVDQKKLRRRLR